MDTPVLEGHYEHVPPIWLDGYTDSDMSTDVDTSRSISGYVMTYAGGAVSWQSRLQKTVALSTTEVEYMAAMDEGIHR